MQDRYKFKIWDKTEKKFLPLDSKTENTDSWISIDNTGVYLVERDNARDVAFFTDITEDVIILQCTGLKDKNGKLIYEGDIVKIEYYDFEIKHRIGIVEWEDDGFCITYHNPKDTKVSGCSLVDIVNGDKQEVIGNIYENLELLKEVKE